jgi:uncharacterized alpha-E superfamily protein
VVKAELDLFRAVLDRRADHGLAANLQRLSWCATQAREHLSLDHWHALKRLSAEIEACRDRASDVSALLEFLDEALTTFVSLSGFAMDTMTRDMGWRLHIIGRRLERLDNLAGTLARFLRRYTGLDSRSTASWPSKPCSSCATRSSPTAPATAPSPSCCRRSTSSPWTRPTPTRWPSSCAWPATTSAASRRAARPGPGRAGAGLRRPPGLPLEALEASTPEADRHAACVLLATRLEALADAGRQLSDRLAMRFFSHVGGNRQATFAA